MLELALAKSTRSTQLSLIQAIKNGFNKSNFAFVSLEQSNGVGTQNRLWQGDKLQYQIQEELFKIDYFDEDFIFFDNYENFKIKYKNNLYLSFYVDFIPQDLALQSASIYYALNLKIALKELNSKIFVKWPNDIYLNKKKIGGILINKIKNKLICGVGLNIISSPDYADVLDIDIDLKTLLKVFFDTILKKLSWNSVFEIYKEDFELSRWFCFKLGETIYSLEKAKLYNDGSILLDNKRIYGLR